MSRWSWLGPWPLRPFWQFILIATMQNFGLTQGVLFTGPRDDLAMSESTILGVGVVRSGFALLLAGVVVAAQWIVYRATTGGGRVQSPVAYAAMSIIGAAAAAGVIIGAQAVSGREVLLVVFLGSTVHYLLVILVIQISIGVIGSRMSASAARAEDALTRLGEQERRFVASEERARRIAAEFLHDRVQADLLVIAIELRRVGESAPPEVASQIASITEVVESVRVSEVRDTSRMLSPLVQSAGLASALTTLAQRWRDAMQVSLDVDPEIEAIMAASDGTNPDLSLGVYRIVEQALLNAAAHGQARLVQVSVSPLTRDGLEGVRVHVSDDGIGFETESVVDGGGFAISQVWTRLLGGQWTVQSHPGSGTTVTAWLPVVAPD